MSNATIKFGQEFEDAVIKLGKEIEASIAGSVFKDCLAAGLSKGEIELKGTVIPKVVIYYTLTAGKEYMYQAQRKQNPNAWSKLMEEHQSLAIKLGLAVSIFNPETSRPNLRSVIGC